MATDAAYYDKVTVNMAMMGMKMKVMTTMMKMKLAPSHKGNNLRSYMAVLQRRKCIRFVIEALVAVMIESFLANKPHLVEHW